MAFHIAIQIAAFFSLSIADLILRNLRLGLSAVRAVVQPCCAA